MAEIVKNCQSCNANHDGKCIEHYRMPMEVADWCVNWTEPKISTNADRIRSMTDEELGAFLEKGVCGEIPKCLHRQCKDCITVWIKKEAE